ncbi:fused MFS/spermidine synthase, partial [Verrucomicrobia bacterium]|nr:fused MFS/spermidine synthase [Verrucomicrobiota bacterium]
GLAAAMQLAAFVNLAVGAAAIILARKYPTSSSKSEAASTEEASPASKKKFNIRTAYIVVATTGAASMGLEVLSARSLTLVFGGSLQSFALVLMAFILGIGLGSSIIASPRFRWLKKNETTAVLMGSAALLIALYINNVESLIDTYRLIKTGLSATPMGYMMHQLLVAGCSLVFLGIPAGLLGAVLPLWIRSGTDSKDDASLASQIGTLLTWNTVGAVVGSLLMGFVLMPVFGLRISFAIAALGLALAACLLLKQTGRQEYTMAGGAVTLVILFLFVSGGERWKHILSSGVFRFRETSVREAYMDTRIAEIELVYFKDAADATVSVEISPIDREGNTQMALRINGKPDATSSSDLSTQYLLAHIPILAKPDAKDVFVLGFGSGITAGAVLGHPVENLTIAENCAPVLEAAKHFAPWNNDVLSQPRTTVRNEDARTVLKLEDKMYDIIISEPSNPWMVGVGSVFSQEFYDIANNRLKEGGVFAQWFHLYEMHDGIVLMILRTFASRFPHMEVWDTGAGDIVMLGSQQPWALSDDHFNKMFERAGVKADLEKIGITSPTALWARQFASQRTAFAIPGDGPVQTDQFPSLEYAAPQSFYLGADSRILATYDERTWQRSLCPEPKATWLSNLDDNEVKQLFGTFPSANQELKGLLARQFQNQSTDSTEPSTYVNMRRLTTIWSEANSLTDLPVPTDEDALQLYQAEKDLMGADWKKGASKILELLKLPVDGEFQFPPEPGPGYFAEAAARKALLQGDITLSLELIEAGRLLQPISQLDYLDRIIQRFAAPAAQN